MCFLACGSYVDSYAACDAWLQVVLVGLGVVVPRVTTELLAYPALSAKFFSIVAFVFEVAAGDSGYSAMGSHLLTFLFYSFISFLLLPPPTPLYTALNQVHSAQLALQPRDVLHMLVRPITCLTLCTYSALALHLATSSSECSYLSTPCVSYPLPLPCPLSDAGFGPDNGPGEGCDSVSGLTGGIRGESGNTGYTDIHIIGHTGHTGDLKLAGGAGGE